MTYRLKVLAARYLGYSQHLILLHTNTLSLDITNKKKKKCKTCVKKCHILQAQENHKADKRKMGALISTFRGDGAGIKIGHP